MNDPEEFLKELEELLHKYEMGKLCATHENILAGHMIVALANFKDSTLLRDQWLDEAFKRLSN